MTNREFFVAVKNNESLPADVREHAENQLSKLDAANAKRASTQSKKSKENEPLKVAIYEYLLTNGTKTSPDIATALTANDVGGEDGVTTSKVSSMCRQMVDDGRLTATDVKIPKKGKLKAYTAVIASLDNDDMDDTEMEAVMDSITDSMMN